MKASPKITVLMPVYNGEHYLRPAIDSVLIQDFNDFELIIVDDGSTDGTVGIVRSYHDARIRLLQNPRNLGIVGALQAGLHAAQGEYVARLDADDVCCEGRLRLQLAYLDDHPHIMVLGGACEQIDGAGAFLGAYCGPTVPILVDWELLFRNPIIHSTVMYRRTEILDKGGYRPNFPHAEDYDLWRRISSTIPESIAQLKTPLIRFRKHLSQISATSGTTMQATADDIAKANIEGMLDRTVDLQAVSCLAGHAPVPCREAVISAAYTILNDCWEHFSVQRVTRRTEASLLFSAILPHLIRVARQNESLRFRALSWAWRNAWRGVPGQLFTPGFVLFAARIALPGFLLRAWVRFKSRILNIEA